jgi:hypothetical protein
MSAPYGLTANENFVCFLFIHFAYRTKINLLLHKYVYPYGSIFLMIAAFELSA